MPSLKYLPPEDKRMYLIAILGAGSLAFGTAAEAIPAMGMFLYPAAVICAVGFVAAFMWPAERLFPLRTLPRRASPVLSAWFLYLIKVLMFFGGLAAALYLLSRVIRSVSG